MRIGFTGTQHGMSAIQKLELVDILTIIMTETPDSEFHHGDCIGADAEAAIIAARLNFIVVGHPPNITTKRAFFKSDLTVPALPYLARNKKIVDSCQLLIAAPNEDIEVLRSGTWSTVRYARKTNVPVYVMLNNDNP